MKVYLITNLLMTRSHFRIFSFLNESLNKEPKILTQIEHKDSPFAMRKARITNLENSLRPGF